MNILGLYLPMKITIITLSMTTLSEGLTIALQSGVKRAERELILKIHNNYRLQAAEGKIEDQPRATNMKPLCWDKKLADAAQRIANKMVYHYESVHDERWSHVGQNMAVQTSVAFPSRESYWKTIIRSWFVEVKDYTFSDMPLGATRRYTQLVWAKTSHIGCGFATFIDDTQVDKFRMLYVCNYGPGGNIKEMTPYQTGPKGCKGLCKSKCEH